MDKVTNQQETEMKNQLEEVSPAGIEVEWEQLFPERLALSPPEISMDYALTLTIALFQFRDLIKEIDEEHRDAIAELDNSYNDLLEVASRDFYRLGFLDGLKYRNEGDR